MPPIKWNSIGIAALARLRSANRASFSAARRLRVVAGRAKTGQAVKIREGMATLADGLAVIDHGCHAHTARALAVLA